MSSFFISTSRPPEFDETIEYRINESEYAASLRRQWPYAKVTAVPIARYILHWELDRKDRLGLSGGLQANRLVVSFGNAPHEDVIDFIIWHRAYVPPHQSLFLFDESLSLVLELEPGVRPEDLKKAFP